MQSELRVEPGLVASLHCAVKYTLDSFRKSSWPSDCVSQQTGKALFKIARRNWAFRFWSPAGGFLLQILRRFKTRILTDSFTATGLRRTNLARAATGPVPEAFRHSAAIGMLLPALERGAIFGVAFL